MSIIGQPKEGPELMLKILRTLCAAFAMVIATLIVATLPAKAQLKLDITKGVVEPMPIAITDFLSGDQLGTNISNVIAADLERSGLFAPVDKGAFIEKISILMQHPALRIGR